MRFRVLIIAVYLFIPAGLLILSLIDSVGLRLLLFEFLADFTPYLPDWTRYVDKPFLNPVGAKLVALIWAILVLAVESLIGLVAWLIKRIRRRTVEK
jgi:hypothetical protein